MLSQKSDSYGLIFWCIILSTYRLSHSFIIDSYEIKDLETIGSTFVTEAAQWTYTALYSGITDYSLCNQTYLLGGYGILVNNNRSGTYFERTFTNLPVHLKIYFTFDLWVIDSWDPTDGVSLELDALNVPILKGDYGSISSSLLICGNLQYPDLGQVRIFGSISHTSISLTFQVTGYFNSPSTDESFGFRNVDLLFSSNSYPIANQACATSTITRLGSYDCGCSEGFYKTASGSCEPCHCACSSCFGPSEKQCFQCASNYPYNITHCSSANTSCFTCDRSDDGIIDADDVCKDCQEMIINYVQETTSGYRYTLTLFPASCDLDQSVVQKSLKMTPTSGVLSLKFSFQVTKLSANTYKVDLILQGSVFLETEMAVSLHYLKAKMAVPKRFIPSAALQQIAQQVPLMQNTIRGSLGASLGGTMLIGATGAIWSIIGFQQFIMYFRYINIEYPFQVDLFFSLSDSLNWILPNPVTAILSSFEEDILEDKENSVQDQLPPDKFVENNMTSSFIDNAGTIITTNLILLFILVRWNIIARIFLENGIPLALAIFLQLRTISFDNRYLVICSTLTIISCIYFFAMSLFLIKAMIVRSNSHLDRTLTRRIFGTLYEGMVLEDTIGKYYNLIILFRGVLLVLLVAFIETVPLFQIIPLVCVNMGLIYLLFNKIFFEDQNLNFLNRLKEILFLRSELCIAGLYIEVNSEMYYELLGRVIVGGLGLIYILELGYIIVRQLLSIKTIARKFVNAYRTIRACLKRKGQRAPNRTKKREMVILRHAVPEK